MKTVIIKYGSGNTRSVDFALRRLGVSGSVSDDPEEIRAADKVIFPGVGEASSAMKYLLERKLDTLIKELKQPVLGICLGMQLLCECSEEGNTECLGIFKQKVKKFNGGMKVPQIGWNNISNLKGKLFKGLSENEFMYFVHGYFAEQSKATVALTEYGPRYSSALQNDNFYGVQFHPEKSGTAGEMVLKNFLEL